MAWVIRECRNSLFRTSEIDSHLPPRFYNVVVGVVRTVSAYFWVRIYDPFQRLLWAFDVGLGLWLTQMLKTFAATSSAVAFIRCANISSFAS